LVHAPTTPEPPFHSGDHEMSSVWKGFHQEAIALGPS